MRKYLLLMLTLFALLGASPVHALVPVHWAPSPGYTTVKGGFSIQPHSQYTTLVDKTVILTFETHANSLMLGPNVTYQLWQYRQSQWTMLSQLPEQSAAKGQFLITPNEPGTYYFQIKAGWKTLLQTANYYSNGFAITVNSKDIPATSMTVSLGNDIILPGQGTIATAHLTPENATSPVKWHAAPDGIVAIDADTGEITSFRDQIGRVRITATAGNLSASSDLIVGGVRNQTVPAGSAVTFNLNGLTDDGKSSYQWYTVDAAGQRHIINDATDIAYSFVTHDEPDLTLNPDQHLRLQVRVTPDARFNAGEAFWSNVAELTLTPPTTDSIPTLAHVPNFSFEPASVQSVLQGATAIHATTAERLEVRDAGVHPNAEWELRATLSPFKADNAMLRATLKLPIDGQEVDLLADNQPRRVVARPRGEGFTTTSQGSFLQLDQDVHTSAGAYQATLTWQLANVPTT